MTYKERIRAIAEDLAHGAGLWDKICNPGLKNQFISQYLKQAEIAVAYMSDIAKSAYKQGAFDVRSGLHGDLIDADLYCKTEGLIPDSAQPFESSNFAKFMKGYYGDSAQEGGKDETI